MMQYFHSTFTNNNEIDLFIIIGGQSNSKGYTLGVSPSRPELTGDIPRAFIWDTDDYYTLNYPNNNNGDLFSYNLSLAYNYTSKTKRPVYIEKTAYGGTGLFVDAGLDWNVSSDELIVDLEDSLTRLKNKAAALGSTNPKFVMVWMQGERDTKDVESVNYEQNFKDILDRINVIQRLDLVVLNVLNPDIVNAVDRTETWVNNVRNAQIAIGNTVDYVEVMDMSAYDLADDHIHYPAAVQETIGDGVYQIIKRKFEL